MACAAWVGVLSARAVDARLQAAPPAGEAERALAAARTRAAAGDVVAQYSLGVLMGADPGADPAESLAWLERAAVQGHAPAAFALGQAIDTGRRGPPDPDGALRWYRRAAEGRFAPAARVLGDAYRLGRGVGPDPAIAARWYLQGAEGGDLQAQYRIGQACFDGVGVARDYVWAYVWFDRAAAQTPLDDNRRALEELRNIAAVRMSDEELARAQAISASVVVP